MGESLSLIIGDHFADRMLYWSVGSLMPNYLGGGFTTLIVSPSRLEDDDFFSALVNFLNARNGVHPTHGSRSVELVSVSLSNKALNAIRERFNAFGSLNVCYVRGQITLDSAVPSAAALERVWDLTTGHPFDRLVRWSEFPVMGSEVRPPEVFSDHLVPSQSEKWGKDHAMCTPASRGRAEMDGFRYPCISR